jgi:hypothetical protein
LAGAIVMQLLFNYSFAEKKRDIHLFLFLKVVASFQEAFHCQKTLHGEDKNFKQAIYGFLYCFFL